MSAVLGVHAYRSTACYHGQHDKCRLHCKFCAVQCFCGCHNGKDPIRIEYGRTYQQLEQDLDEAKQAKKTAESRLGMEVRENSKLQKQVRDLDSRLKEAEVRQRDNEKLS